MKNGNASEFIAGLHYGDERFFLYNQKKYFIEGWKENDKFKIVLYVIEDPNDNFKWESKSIDDRYPVEEFESAKIFEGKDFWEVEKDIVWVDC